MRLRHALVPVGRIATNYGLMSTAVNLDSHRRLDDQRPVDYAGRTRIGEVLAKAPVQPAANRHWRLALPPAAPSPREP